MKKLFLNILKYALFLGLGVFLVWWSLNQIPDNKWAEFKTAFATANYWLFIPVFFILIASHFLRALRWKILMKPLGYSPNLINVFFAVMVGYLANLAIPRLGEILKCTILARYEKVPADKLVGTIMAERAFDLLSLLALFLLALLFQYDIVAEYGGSLLRQILRGKSGGISATKTIIIVAAVILVILLFIYSFKKFPELKFVRITSGILKGIWQGIISVKGLQQKLPFVLCSVMIWTLYLLGTWLGFYATVGTAGLGADVALSALAFGSIGMIVTPGGIGAYALFMAKVLEKNGVPFELGIANGTLQWFAQFIIVLIAGFISLGMLPYINKTKIIHEESRDHTT